VHGAGEDAAGVLSVEGSEPKSTKQLTHTATQAPAPSVAPSKRRGVAALRFVIWLNISTSRFCFSFLRQARPHR
jgi:hypothetical protein